MTGKNSRQAKTERKSRKAAKNERRKRERRRDSRPAFALASGLDEAEQHLKKRRLHEAAGVLEELARRYPRRLEVLEMLLEVYFQQRDMWSYQSVCQRLIEFDPDSADTWLSLGAAALSNFQMATAHRAFNHLLSHWPNHTEADKARENCEKLEELMRSEGDNYKMRPEDRDELLLMHDEINLHLHQGQYDRAIDMAGRLLERCPNFAPALNNRSEAQFRTGELDLAVADAKRVLEFDVDNFHALSNLTRFLFLSGQADDARAIAEQLRTAKSDSPLRFVKQAESLGILGDWPGILVVLEQAEERKVEDEEADIGLLYHLAGVAAAELGQLENARRHWKRAIKMQTAAEWAQQNLQDLKQSPGEANGAWAFPVEHWIPRATIDRLAIEMGRGGKSVGNAEIRRRVRKYLAKHSYLERLAPHLLERGDATAKEFVVRILSLGETPSVLAALRDFAFGRRGSDKVRYAAAMRLIEAGAIEPGLQRMWVIGELRDLHLMSYEIISEPIRPLPKEVQELAQEAWEAIHDEDGAVAESLLNKALKLHPNDPSLEFNRTVAIRLQGREAEALALVRDLHTRDPDYFFARITLAEEMIKGRDFESARSMLDPLLARRRFHLSEYTAMCHANIALLVTKGEKEGARAWLKMWQEVAPDDDRAGHWDLRLNRGGLLRRILQ